MRTLKCDPNIEVLGSNVLGIISNLQEDEIRPYLEKHGLTHVEEDKWYPAQKWLDVMNDLIQNTDQMSNLVAVGLEVANHLTLPPEMATATLPMILEGWNAIYQMQHRGGDIGYVAIEKISDTHFKTTHKHLYPDNLTYGVAFGLARRFLPKGTSFTVKYDDNIPRMDEGGDLTIIHIMW